MNTNEAKKKVDALLKGRVLARTLAHEDRSIHGGVALPKCSPLPPLWDGYESTTTSQGCADMRKL